MTDEEISIAIAKACGWHDLSIVDGTACGLKQKVTSLNGRYEPIPDYCNDLNAMHEAEKVLANQFTTIEEGYWRHLEHVQPHHIYATARQRAEAFLKTLDLWRE